jgi:hypothetical protein
MRIPANGTRSSFRGRAYRRSDWRIREDRVRKILFGSFSGGSVLFEGSGEYEVNTNTICSILGDNRQILKEVLTIYFAIASQVLLA